MLWSNEAIFKKEQVDASIASKVIVTQIPLIKKKQTTSSNNHLKKDEVAKVEKAEKTEKIAEKIVDQKKEELRLEQQEQLKKIENLKEKVLKAAEKKAQQQLQNAFDEAEAIKQKAYQEGYEFGKKEGHTKGYKEGRQEATIKTEKQLFSATETLNDAIQIGNNYVKEKEQEIIEFSLAMAKAITKTQFKMDHSMILQILKPMLVKLEQPDQLIVIHAHSKHYEDLVGEMKRKQEQLPTMRFLVAKDDQMALSDLTVETDQASVVFNLQEELQLFLKEITEET